MHGPASTTSTTDANRRQQRIAAVSVGAALLLVCVKLGAGIASGSLGLLAEALHSGADLAAAILTLAAIRVAQRPADRRHPWGHGRAEHLAALGEAILLLAATGYIAVEAVRRLLGDHPGVTVEPWLLGVMIVVIAIDVWRTVASLRASREFDSPAMASNTLHFASDLAGSIAVFIGLGLVWLGFGAGDALAAMFVSALIAVGAGRLLWDNAQVLMDHAPEGAERAATRAVNALELPVSLRRLRIRRSAGAYLADVVIGVSAIDHVSQGHALADAVEQAVELALPGSDVVVHVEPDDGAATMRDRITAAALAIPGIHEVHNVRVLLLDDVPEVSLHLKVRGDLRLDAAHDLADQVEHAVRASVPDLSHVDLHIEPVDAEASVADEVRDASIRDAAIVAVRDVTGRAPVNVRVRDTPRGIVAYVSVLAAADQPVRDAHRIATRVENRICEEAPVVAEVIVHTEPFDEHSVR